MNWRGQVLCTVAVEWEFPSELEADDRAAAVERARETFIELLGQLSDDELRDFIEVEVH